MVNTGLVNNIANTAIDMRHYHSLAVRRCLLAGLADQRIDLSRYAYKGYITKDCLLNVKRNRLIRCRNRLRIAFSFLEAADCVAQIIDMLEIGPLRKGLGRKRQRGGGKRCLR